MNTFLNSAAYVLLLVTLVLIGHIRALKKKHAKEIVNVIDDSLTARKYLREAEQLIKNYMRTQEVDNAMIERLLRGLETDKEYRVELLSMLTRYKLIAGMIQSNLTLCNRYKQNLYDGSGREQIAVPAGYFKLAQDALIQLIALNDRPDARQPTKPGAAGDGSAASGTTA